mgnify:FL=1
MMYESQTRVLIICEESIGDHFWYTYSWMIYKQKNGWMTSDEGREEMLREIYAEDHDIEYEKNGRPISVDGEWKAKIHHVKIIHPLNFLALIEEGILNQ